MATEEKEEKRPREEEEEDPKEDDEEEEEEGPEGGEAPSHLPFAPSSELLDISTTVDPGYIISLIRKLLPCESTLEKQSQVVDEYDSSIQGSDINCSEQNFRDKMMDIRALEDVDLHKSSSKSYKEKVDRHTIDPKESPASANDHGMIQEVGKERNGFFGDEKSELPESKDLWEDSGCILWDLAACRNHAEFMVNNLLLEVLLANLRVSKSFRAKEICLGIIGNLACHEVPSSKIISTSGLIETVVDQLFLDDSACLSETFRLLAVGLQGSRFAPWVEALLPDEILLRILWIVGNTLNSTLLEKGIEFLLTIIDNQKVARILLQPLIKMGLPRLVSSLLTCEMGKLGDENRVERSSSLDLVLRFVEALTIVDNFSQIMPSSEELFHLVCGVVKLPDKIEVASSCVSAVVIVANLLVDEQQLTSDLSHDYGFLQGLLDILPFVSDDSQARNALWSIMARLLVQVQENDISISTLHQFASLLVDKSYLIEEDLESHPTDALGEDLKPTACQKPFAIATSLRRIACIVKKWISEKSPTSERVVAGSEEADGKAQRLLNYCRKYGS